MVLIKSILSLYPIFSCAIFADTKEVIRSFNMEIRSFSLFVGGWKNKDSYPLNISLPGDLGVIGEDGKA